MPKKRHSITADAQKKCILRQLLYYDIFDHLLSKEELIRDCSFAEQAEVCLDEMLKQEQVFEMDGYYSVRKDKRLVEKRKKGEENTRRSMPRARKMARLISQFPFVRAVALSGSISKGYMDSFKDVDYFIITKPNRLWLSRTMLVFYKKVFLLNSFRFFCLNYFIDENNLEITDQNIFTATELNTLIPIYGFELTRVLQQSNNWVRAYYGSLRKNETQEEKPYFCFIKRTAEFLLSNFLGNWLDLFAMHVTVEYWKWKYRGSKSYLFKTSFRFRRDEAKYHPGNFQELILKKYDERVKMYERKLQIRLNDEN